MEIALPDAYTSGKTFPGHSAALYGLGSWSYSKDLFSWQNFEISNTVALSFVFDKYYLIMD